MSFAVCLEIADFPVFSSSSCRAFLAMAPPCCATFLLGSSPCGLVALEISVVDTSASILRTNSVFVILSRRLSFFSPLYALYSPVAMHKAGIRNRMLDRPVKVRFYWDDGLDCDNHAVLGKAFLDAMKGYILPDDNRKWVKMVSHEFWDGGAIKVEIMPGGRPYA